MSLELPATSLPVISEHPEYHHEISLSRVCPRISWLCQRLQVSRFSGLWGPSDLRLDEMQQQQMQELQRLQQQWQLLGFMDRVHFVNRGPESADF